MKGEHGLGLGLGDTIAAPATPMGLGAVGVIRLSGPRALELAARVFEGKDPRGLKGGRFTLGYIRDPRTGERLDQALMLVFRAPRSYTGEDVVEFQVHGSPAVMRAVLDLLYREGARPAGPGEFTLRAYLNGRLDLAQAEALLALIEAQSEKARRQALRGLEGETSRRIAALRERLLDLLAELQAGLDYPEEGLDLRAKEAVLAEALGEVEAVLEGARRGRLAHRGVRLVLLGAPNAGKSSLLNALLGYERALVSPIPGTTRDYLEAPLELFGLPLVAVDTAGIRETDDPIERAGVERALRLAEEADLVLYLADRSQPKPPEPPLPPRTLRVATKADLPPLWEDPGYIPVSSLTGEGLDRLKEAIREALEAEEEGVYLSDRQVEALTRAKEALLEARGLPEDLLGLALEEAVQALGAFLGARPEAVGEEVVARVFQNFCVGK